MKHRITGFLLSGMLALGAAGVQPGAAAAAEPLQTDTTLSYAESAETVNNPGMGYTSTLWYCCKPGNTPVQNPTGSLVLMFIDIGAFSSGENGTKQEDGTYTPGTDYPLDDAFFAGLRGTLENCRTNGCTVALRFRYDDDGTTNPEPASWGMLRQHIQQIADSGLLEDYKDILMYVESGFVGCYGEQWGGKYCSLEYKAELLDLLLDVVPDPIPVTVRTPNIFAKWAGIETKDLADWVSEPGSRAARVGLYDDGYMGSDSDLGTYSNRAIETAWLGKQTETSYFGGEFSGNLEWAQKYETYLPQNAIPEMYQTHLSYINSNIWSLYKDYTFSAEYDVPQGDHSAYYGENVYKFMRDHLGYRFVLRDSRHTVQVKQGGTLELAFQVENTGFAAPIRAQQAELLLEKDGDYYRTPVSLDSRTWRSCETVTEQLSAALPGSLEPGDWRIYLKLSVGDNPVQQLSARSVRFANDGIWNAALGANYLGTVTVTESDDAASLTQPVFGSTEHPQRYTVSGLHITDGVQSNSGELGGEPAASSDTAVLYLANDEQYLYITAEFPDTGEAPVFNIQLTNQDTDTYYWLYYANNGFIYFNQGTPDGILQKHSDHLVEFRIPLGDVMGLKLGTTLSYVRFFLQDSANDWKLLSDVRSGEYVLTGDFPVYTAAQTLALCEGDTLPLSVLCDAADAKYQWYHDGKAIAGASGAAYTLPAADAGTPGVYTVTVTSAAGTEKQVTVCTVTTVYPRLSGDFNGDGKFDRQDAADLAAYLTGTLTQPANWRAGDLHPDGKLNAADLTVMKRMLL
ncbi:MAG: DUF4832 domain-containing protein [Oscillospiraceae bacterium]|nr:DUF4832 domain-containing protein [Oscillospiraceae bacterium]